MKRIAVLIGVMLLVSACGGPRMKWTKPDMAADQYRMDEARCQMEWSKAIAGMKESIWQSIQARRVYENCMISQGYIND